MGGRQKTFRTLDEQISILQDKGLIISDIEVAKKVLFRENYFFLNGYRHFFIKASNHKQFQTGTSFEELYSVFRFDRAMRNILFQYLLIIENNIKSIFSYQLSKKYGIKEKDYLDPKNFTEDHNKTRYLNDVLSKMKRQIRKNVKQHSATNHYLTNYGYIPLWILVKVLSFGLVSDLFNVLKENDQLALSEVYDLDVETLSIYLAILANFRNLCAHEDILYDHRTQRLIPDSKYHYLLNIEMTDNEYIYGKNDLFALIIIMKYMLSDEEFRQLIYEIGYEVDLLSGRVQSVSLNSMLSKIGFPENWRDILDY